MICEKPKYTSLYKSIQFFALFQVHYAMSIMLRGLYETSLTSCIILLDQSLWSILVRPRNDHHHPRRNTTRRPALFSHILSLDNDSLLFCGIGTQNESFFLLKAPLCAFSGEKFRKTWGISLHYKYLFSCLEFFCSIASMWAWIFQSQFIYFVKTFGSLLTGVS